MTASATATDTVLIIDFGSQVTQLIARRVREAGVYSEIVPFNQAEAALERLKPKAIMLSGGPASVTDEGSPRAPQSVFEQRPADPFASATASRRRRCSSAASSRAGTRPSSAAPRSRSRKPRALFDGVWQVGKRYPVWMSHGDRVTRLPDGFTVKATSENAPFAIASRREAPHLHDHVPPRGGAHAGRRQAAVELRAQDRRPQERLDAWRISARRRSPRSAPRSARRASSAGCRAASISAVAAVLIHEAIGDQLTCIFVDHGLLRQNEAEEVVRLFREHYNIPLIHVDARDRFLAALAGVSDPEAKRKTIGALFIDVFDEEAKKLGGADFLAQGTLYPDVIESVSFTGGPSVTIKSHHNVGGLPERMNLKLVEPLRELFKDEVRALGRELGLPAHFVGRHPFPGPGLAIRIPGEITEEKLAILRQADAIYLDEIRKAGLYDEIWQAFAVLLPVRTVGVMGDARTYDYVCALRAVTSTDGMTADYYDFPHAFLGPTATRIINEVRGINRVVYDITSKPPGTIEWE